MIIIIALIMNIIFINISLTIIIIIVAILIIIKTFSFIFSTLRNKSGLTGNKSKSASPNKARYSKISEGNERQS